MEQLEFFEKTDTQLLEERVTEMEKSLHKVRKALFARHGELAKMYLELHEEHMYLLQGFANYQNQLRMTWKKRTKIEKIA